MIRPRAGARRPGPAPRLAALLASTLLAGACATPVGVDPIPPQDFQRQVNPGHLPLSWKVLLSGHAAEYAHDNGQLDPSLPFEELRRRSRINAAAGAADRAHDFSRRIREGLPSMGGPAGPGS